MHYSISTFFNDIANNEYDVFSIDLQQNGLRIASLQNELQRSVMDNKAIDQLVESQNFHNGKWTRYNIMISSFLRYCRDIDPWSRWDSCDVIFQFYSDLNNCLLNDSYPVDDLVSIYLKNTEYVISYASNLDDNYRILNTRKFQFLSYVSSVISKLFNSIKSNRTLEDSGNKNFLELPEKQKILLYLVNKLNNIYFRIESPQLCSNILKNFKPKSALDQFSQYPILQRIEYKYLLGRYYLLNSRVTNAFVQLNSAFEQLLRLLKYTNIQQAPQLTRNINRILKYLVPTGLIMGKLPKLEMIESVNKELVNMYQPLVSHLRSGNVAGVNNWLQFYEQELCENHLLILLLEKLPIIAYRYLVRLVIQDWSIAQNSNKLAYDVLEKCMKTAIKDDTHIGDQLTIYNGIHSSKNVENILVTLINLGYLRGNCFPLLKVCVFQRTNNINNILPNIQEKMVSMFPLNNEDSWLES